MIHPRFFRLCCCLLVAAALPAQRSLPVPAPITTPNLPAPVVPDDPELLYSFFATQDDLGQWMDPRKAAAPAGGSELDSAAAGLLSVQVADLAHIRAVSHQVLQDLRKLQQQLQQDLARSNRPHNNPDRLSLWQYASRRQFTLLAAANQLQRTLSAASWNGLHTYILTKHKQTMGTTVLKAGN